MTWMMTLEMKKMETEFYSIRSSTKSPKAAQTQNVNNSTKYRTVPLENQMSAHTELPQQKDRTEGQKCLEKEDENIKNTTNPSEPQSQEDVSRWIKFRQLAADDSFKGNCSSFLKEMELDDGLSEADSEINEGLDIAEKILIYSSTKRNLSSELD